MQNLAKENEYIMSQTNFHKPEAPEINIENETVLALLTSSFDMKDVSIKSA